MVDNNFTDKSKTIVDKYGKEIVVIDEIRFKGKRAINWDDVRNYLRQFVGRSYTVSDTKDLIFIGNDLPNEYAGSEYTYKLNGTVAKAKANASQGIPELITTAKGKHFRENNEEKHNRNAKYGWYRYDTRFAIPVYAENGTIERYNAFHASLIVRHSEDKKMYLYDVIDVKKETSNPLEHLSAVHDTKPIS
ncbi:MAG: hypothetical protein E7307_07465 [Butyrivibrio sp.]|nr:hypothetical protein [Butyrivibrio sp.]